MQRLSESQKELEILSEESSPFLVELFVCSIGLQMKHPVVLCSRVDGWICFTLEMISTLLVKLFLSPMDSVYGWFSPYGIRSKQRLTDIGFQSYELSAAVH